MNSVTMSSVALTSIQFVGFCEIAARFVVRSMNRAIEKFIKNETQLN